MAKKAKEESQKTFNLTVLGLLVFVVLTAYLVTFKAGVLDRQIISSSDDVVDTQIDQSVKDATESGVVLTATPKPVVQTVPVNYGKQVSVPILYYHYVGNNPNPEDKARDSLSISPDKFDEQMGYIISSGYQTISLDTLYAALKGQVSLPAKPIIITFDDGYIDFYINAFPILKKYNMHTIAFIATGLVGQPAYMNWGQIKEIDATGLVVFQAHSVSHPNLTTLNGDQVKSQLSESKKVLEGELGKPVNFMAYPYGASNALSWEKARESGYLGAVGTWSGKIVSEGNIYNMPRIRVSGFWNIEEFKKRI